MGSVVNNEHPFEGMIEGKLGQQATLLIQSMSKAKECV